MSFKLRSIITGAWSLGRKLPLGELSMTQLISFDDSLGLIYKLSILQPLFNSNELLR